MSGPGAVAANFHAGSRSEQFADFLFSAWGTVSPVRRQDDTGVDLFCTLTDRVGQRAIVTDHFVVQVKSNADPWVFDTPESVAWLVNYPQPLFLACVDKRAGVVSIYQVMPRFYAGALPPLPERLELLPTDDTRGAFTQWTNHTNYSLGAPILRVSCSQLFDEARMETLKSVFATWVRIDQVNCDLRRQGLFRFRMPGEYTVNEMPSNSIGEVGYRAPRRSEMTKAILSAAEASECVSAQLANLVS